MVGDPGSVFAYECTSDEINGNMGIDVLSTCNEFLT